MKNLNRWVLIAAVGAALSLSTGQALAQRGGAGGGGRRGGGQPDPEQLAQFRQRQMDNYREALEVTKDDEWTAISDRIGKLMDAQTAARTARGGFGGGRAGRNGGNGADPAAGGANGGGRRGGAFGGTPDPDLEALQKAIDAKAPADEIKAKLAKYRDSHKAKQDALAKAQEDLKKILTARQEAIAVTLGLLS